MKAALTAAALLLGGCAHLGGPRPAWICGTEAPRGPLIANSIRYLDEQGRQLRGTDTWIKGFQLDPRTFFSGEWKRGADALGPADGTVTLELVARSAVATRREYRLELRTGSPQAVELDGKLTGSFDPAARRLTLGWSRLAAMLARGQPLYLAAVARNGTVLDFERLDPNLFAEGLQLVRETDAGVRLKMQNFRTQCQAHEEIIAV